MKLFITIIFFIIGVKINAMNLLDYKVDEKKITLEDWKFFSDQVMGGVSEGKTSLKKDADDVKASFPSPSNSVKSVPAAYRHCLL